jgi:hypothetical protein
MKLEEIFNQKRTENGDIAFTKINDDNLLNLLFLTEYYQNHLSEVQIGNTEKDQLFARFVRDPRFGLGRRDLGRVLMHMAGCSIEDIVKSGRVDDLFVYDSKRRDYYIDANILDYLKREIENGNELVKKWMPRYSSKNLMIARQIAKYWGMTKQQYGHFIKCNTTENKLSRKNTREIKFEQVPSLAMIKYFNRFQSKEDTKARFEKYLEDVRSGKKELKIATTTVYDIYRNRDKIDPVLFFDKIEKIKINAIPIVDTSGSMCNGNDSIGKAYAIGHYLAKCSTYAPNKVITFSSRPSLLTLGVENVYNDGWGYRTENRKQNLSNCKNQYEREIQSMYTGDCSNTDFGKVMELLKDLTDLPEYLVVLSDCEFDIGSSQSKSELERLWKANGWTTKIVWWNLNERSITVPEMDSHGNIYLSGYSPMLLKFLEVGFDGTAFLNKLLDEYKKAVG